MSLASLLGPLSTEQFARRCWGRQPLHVRRAEREFFASLLSLSSIERQLSQAEFFERQAITAPRLEYGAPDPPVASLGDLQQRLQLGSSVRLRRMERWLSPSEPLMRLGRCLELELQHPLSSISCYITPSNAVGLGPHHDETEIFTLQVSGRKRWRLYHRVNDARPGLHRREELGEPAQDLLLEPGELLYLPRGWIHDVTNDEPSFSLTLVFDPIRWNDMLALLLSRLQAAGQLDPTLGEPLPAGELLRARPSDAFVDAFHQRIRSLRAALDELTPELLAAEAARELLERLPLPPQPGRSCLLELEALSLDTLLEKRPGIAYRLLEDSGRITLLLSGGYRVQMNAKAAPALRAITAQEGPFRIRQMPHGLSDPAKLALARQLVGAGLLCLV